MASASRHREYSTFECYSSLLRTQLNAAHAQLNKNRLSIVVGVFLRYLPVSNESLVRINFHKFGKITSANKLTAFHKNSEIYPEQNMKQQTKEYKISVCYSFIGAGRTCYKHLPMINDSFILV